ncbi:MAG TPA: putative dsRNA-binding protein, partial [Usitatibacter sp.]
AFLYLGKGIAKGGGRNLKSLLANMFEAVLGAVFLDAGYDAAYHYYLNRYRALESPVRDENFKGRLQQVAQERFGATPFYDSEGAKVGTHREYTSVVFAGADPLGTGHGASKQEAEQDAAKAALESLLGTAETSQVKPAKTPRPRARRAPRTPRNAPTAATSEGADLAEVIRLPEPEPLPEPKAVVEPQPQPDPEPEPKPEVVHSEPRSRQFGEPLE